MTSNNNQLKPYLAALARLRYCLRAERNLTPDDMKIQDRIYAQSLADFSPAVVNSATEELSIAKGDTKGFWPDLPSLMALCREHQKLAGVATSRALPSPEASAALGATMRNEAILLLGMFRPEAQDACRDDKVWIEFLAEAARVWGRVRPAGGLQEADRVRGGRIANGFALEAWARDALGLTPLHPAYARGDVAETYRRMTGREIEVMTEEQDPLGPAAYHVAINAKPQAVRGVGTD